MVTVSKPQIPTKSNDKSNGYITLEVKKSGKWNMTMGLKKKPCLPKEETDSHNDYNL